MEICDLIIFPDLAKLPKSDLKSICIDMGLDSSKLTFDLAKQIWSEINDDMEKKGVFIPYYNKLLAGRISVSWFNCDDLKGLSQQIIEKEKYNPFEQKIPFEESELETKPRLRSASMLTKNTYYLRFIYKDGTRRIVGEDVEILPTSNTATAYIDEEQGLIEVRASPDEAQKIAEVISGYVKQQLSLRKKDFIKPFGYNIDKIAEILEGELQESKAAPEMWLDTFGVKENEAILEILKALDLYFENNDIDGLQEKLDDAKAILGEELLASPFISIILAGLGNVGLKVATKDLRKTVFYQLLQPYLQPSGGNIRFNVEVGGIEKSFSILIGIESKSIYFKSNSTTEEVIEYVREKLLGATL
ncbi:hypothetical protein [Priestia megaterium]|uniref:hypothetical protein n=1 Tax=Priestia megaterium TaxID=1404 RepID=UPI001FB1E0AE|nr:hypothetical protein [Priestia megaterium]